MTRFEIWILKFVIENSCRNISELYVVSCLLFPVFLCPTSHLSSVSAEQFDPVASANSAKPLTAETSVGWVATYGGDNKDEAHSICQTGDGGYIVAGETKSIDEGIDLWVLKLGPEGTIEWQKTYGGIYNDWADSIQQTSDGGYIVAGGTASFGAGWGDAWVLKLRPNGTVEWQKTYGEDKPDMAHSIQQTRDGGYIVAGETKSFSAGGDEDVDLWVLKLGPEGTTEWQKTYGGAYYDWANSIQQTSDGGYVVAGRTWS